MTDGSSSGSQASRRGFLWLLSVSGLVGYLGFKTMVNEPAPEFGFCPSKSEMEEMSWIRGEFTSRQQIIDPGGEFVSTLEIENSGGQPGTYESGLRLWAYEDNRYVTGRGVEIDVPAHETVTHDVALSVPESFNGGRLLAPGLNSTCDLIQPAVQYVEVARTTKLRGGDSNGG